MTSRPKRYCKSLDKSCPLRKVQLAFLIRPVTGLTAPGRPIPIESTGWVACSASTIRLQTQSTN
ncbi:Uncharacterised protein [Vibrio cholerae]|nr:Uncharacterised protein [Vibrio cholerae]